LLALNKKGVMNMSERQLLGYLPVDSGQISIVDPAHIELVERGDLLTDLLTVDTKIDDGNFPVYFEKDDAEGGYGKSRIIIELGGMDAGEDG
jgi:hypothetical protein